MAKRSKGLHHVTAVVGDPQENVDFYSGILGLRLVKKTVNFDDPGTYHLYFGDSGAEPGTLITFFPWGDAYKGKIGDGQAGVTSYAIPSGAMSFWEQRLKKFAVPFKKSKRFNEEYLQFDDVHGLQLELVEREAGSRSSWEFGDVTRDVAIKGLGGVTLYSANSDKTAELLTEVIGLEKIGEEDGLMRFHSTSDIANVIDLKIARGQTGRLGVGTVHHIAWRADDDADQQQWKERVEQYRLGVTPVQDRNYFNAIYFREYGDLLFEIATETPGFAIDESPESLGEALMLPEPYEKHRKRLLQELPPVTARVLD